MRLGLAVAAVALVLFVEAAALPTAWLPVEEAAVLGPARSVSLETPSAALYPLVLAPAARALDPSGAYRAAQALSIALWALATVPAFLLARRLLPPGPALVAAVLGVLVPGSLYATAAVPDALAFLLGVSSLLLAARGNIAGAVAAAAGAALARPWLVVLPFALLASHELAGTRTLASMRWPRPLALAALAGVAYLVLARFEPETALAVASPGAVLRAAGSSLAAAVVGAGVVPWLLAPAAARPERALLASCLVALALAAGVLGVVAPARGLDERPLLVLGPLVFALAAVVVLERTAGLRSTALAAVGVVLAAFTLPALGAVATDRALGLGLLSADGGSRAFLVPAVAGAAGVAVLFLRVFRRRPLLIGAVVSAVVLAGQVAAWTSVRDQARRLAAEEQNPRNWLDLAAGPEGRVVVAGPPEALDGRVIAQLRLWNRSVRGVQPLDPTRADAQSGQFGIEPAAPLVLPLGPELAGEEVARLGGATLLRPENPYRLAETVEGVEPDGWTGKRAVYRRFSAAPGALLVSLSRVNAPGDARPAEVVIESGPLDEDADERRARFVLRPGEERTVAVDVPEARYRVVVRVTPTFQAPDGRKLGVQVRFEYRRR